MKLKQFTSPRDCLNYILQELIETLEDNLYRQENDEREHYTDEDRQNMRETIENIKSLVPYVTLEGIPQ